MTDRRRLLRQAACAAMAAPLSPPVLASLTALLAGCARSPAVRWYALPLDAPGAASAAAPEAASGALGASAPEAASGKAGTDEVWELSPVIPLPGALDRDTLVVASGGASLWPLAGHRWAEPLRDSVPRIVLHDLLQLRGEGRVWRAPAPAGVAVARRLRIELLALQADSGGHALRLAARWWFQDNPSPPDASAPAKAPVVRSADFSVPIEAGAATVDAPGDAAADALAAAHRVALWRLAQRIAQG